MSQGHVVCPKCETEMHPGFVPDHNDGRLLQEYWFEGEFATRLFGYRPRTKKLPMPVTTYRCASCGYLESYAK